MASSELNANGSQVLHEPVPAYFFKLIPQHSFPLLCFHFHRGFLSDSLTCCHLSASGPLHLLLFLDSPFPASSFPCRPVFFFFLIFQVSSSVSPPHGHMTIDFHILTPVVILNHSTPFVSDKFIIIVHKILFIVSH